MEIVCISKRQVTCKSWLHLETIYKAGKYEKCKDFAKHIDAMLFFSKLSILKTRSIFICKMIRRKKDLNVIKYILLIIRQFDSAKKLQIAIQVLYICVSCWLLAHESRDLSQAETKIIVVEKLSK